MLLNLDLDRLNSVGELFFDQGVYFGALQPFQFFFMLRRINLDIPAETNILSCRLDRAGLKPH